MKKNYAFIFCFVLLFAATRVQAQCSTPVPLPYTESFSSLTASNQLPPCWAASNPGGTCLTYTPAPNGPGGGYAAFSATPAGVSYFYGPAFQLHAGVTYSTGIWFKNDVTGGSNWTDLAILLGPSQSSTGLVSIVSTTISSTNTSYGGFSASFSLTTSGVYYLAIRATSTVGTSQYLYFDDVFFQIPCNAGNNSPNLIATATPSAPCSNQQVTLSVSGADTYSWSIMTATAVNTSSVIIMPPVPGNIIYHVSGTKNLSGCVQTLTQTLVYGTTPQISAFTDSPNNSTCYGMPVVLHAVGTAASYTWDAATSAPSPNATFSPSVNTTYTVHGSSAAGCTSSATIAITVNSLPTITVQGSDSTICAGQVATFTANGADIYSWMVTGGSTLTGSIVSPALNATTSYTVTGINGFTGCQNTVAVTQLVAQCQGIPTIPYSKKILVYPNPNSGSFYIALSEIMSGRIDITDLSGRVLVSHEINAESIQVNLNGFANGMYYVQLVSASSSEVVKIIKE